MYFQILTWLQITMRNISANENSDLKENSLDNALVLTYRAGTSKQRKSHA